MATGNNEHYEEIIRQQKREQEYQRSLKVQRRGDRIESFFGTIAMILFWGVILTVIISLLIGFKVIPVNNTKNPPAAECELRPGVWNCEEVDWSQEDPVAP